jgi:hypothetical protein
MSEQQKKKQTPQQPRSNALAMLSIAAIANSRRAVSTEETKGADPTAIADINAQPSTLAFGSPIPPTQLEKIFVLPESGVDPPGTYVDGKNIYDSDHSSEEDDDEFEVLLVSIDDVDDLIDGCIESNLPLELDKESDNNDDDNNDDEEALFLLTADELIEEEDNLQEQIEHVG